MKKSISIFLVTVMILTVCITAFSTVFANAETQSTELPASKFTGDSQKLAQLQAAYEADIAAATKTQYDIQSADELYALFKAINAKKTNFSGCTISLKCDLIYNEGDATTWGTTPPEFTSWESIGGTTNNAAFYGTFDGEGHTISGVYYVTAQGSNAGFSGILFDRMSGTESAVKNVGIVNSYIKGSFRIGGIVGVAYNKAQIYSCYVDAEVVSTGAVAGGIIAYSDSASVSVEKNVFSGNVKGTQEVGGILGTSRNQTAVIRNCVNFGNVQETGSTGTVGGIAGAMQKNNNVISNCINFGIVDSANDDYDGAAIIGKIYSGTTVFTTTGSYLVSGLAQTQKIYNINEPDLSISVATISANSIKGDAAKTALVAFDFDNEKIWSTRENDYPVPTAVKTIFEGIVPNIGAQLSVDTYTTEGENGYTAQKLRFLAGIDSTADFETIGFIITESKSGQRWNVSGNTVYESVIVATLSGNKVVNASEYDVNYLFALTLDDIPATVDAEFVAIPYAIPTSGNITYYGEVVTYTVTETSIAIK